MRINISQSEIERRLLDAALKDCKGMTSTAKKIIDLFHHPVKNDHGKKVVMQSVIESYVEDIQKEIL